MHFGSKYVFIAKDGPSAESSPLTLEPQPPPPAATNRSIYAEVLTPSKDEPKPKKLLIPADPSPPNSYYDQISYSSLTEEERKFTVKNLLNSTREVTNYNQLGLQLDLKTEDLSNIKASYSDPEDSKASVYDYWIKNDPEASWSKLSKALLQMSGHFVLAQKIQMNYVEGSSPESSIRKKKGNVSFALGPSNETIDGGTTTNGATNGAATNATPNLPRSGPERHPGYQINSNVMSIKFNALSEPKELHTGDAEVCTNKKCTAILGNLSTLVEEKGKSVKTWECEFCQTKNEVDVSNEEIPLKEDVLYLLEPSESVRTSGRNVMEGQTEAASDAIVVFCIDISGSMGCTTEVDGKFKLKGDERTQALFRQHSQGHIQFLPKERRDITYVSRLQGIQGAIEQQLNVLRRRAPTQKVALVTFNNEVTVCSDGRNDVVITGDKLNNYSSLEKIGKSLALPTGLRHTKDNFIDKVTSLEESGQTAMGPAMFISILLAGRIPGSKIIVCTDGMANIGIGRLDPEEITSREKLASAEKFYTELGTLARDKSVTVSILTTKGCESRLLELGRVADITAGRVNVVDPLKVKEDMANILANPILATQVVSKVVLHSDMCFTKIGSKSDDSVLVIPVGNVTNSTELSYEFDVRDRAKPGPYDAAMSKFASTVTIGGEEHIPFQLQIEYTGTDKSRYLRVFTKAIHVTDNLAIQDIGMRDSVIGSHLNRNMAYMSLHRRHPESIQYSREVLDEFIPRRLKNANRIQQRKTARLAIDTKELADSSVQEMEKNELIGEADSVMLRSEVPDPETVQRVTRIANSTLHCTKSSDINSALFMRKNLNDLSDIEDDSDEESEGEKTPTPQEDCTPTTTGGQSMCTPTVSEGACALKPEKAHEDNINKMAGISTDDEVKSKKLAQYV